MDQNNFIKARQKQFTYILGANNLNSFRQTGGCKNDEAHVVFHFKEGYSNYIYYVYCRAIEDVDDRGYKSARPLGSRLYHESLNSEMFSCF